jgi:aspartate aminotransferase-like enzyme
VSDQPILFVPGPVEVDEELRHIMAMPLVGHRSSGFKDRVRAVCTKLPALFRTAQHAFFENVPATGLMEAAIRNLVSRRVLHVTAGAFGDRWKQISTACGREADSIGVAWGEANSADALKQALQRAREPYEAVCITHNETSTGVLEALPALARTVRTTAPGTLILVDAVTSLAGTDLRFDEWGLDLAFAGTQKALALPPGLCVFALSERAIAKSATVPGRGFLLDFAASPERFEKAETPATPCVPLVYALDRQLDRIAAEGLDRRFARHLAMRDATLAWAEEHGFAPLVKDPARRSPTVSALSNSGRDGDQLVAKAKAAGFTLGRGYGKWKNDSFRVGHMGDHDVARVKALLAAIES